MYLAITGEAATKRIDNLSNEKRYVPMKHNHNAHSTTFDEMLAYMYTGGNPFDSSPELQTELSQAEVPMKPLVDTSNADSTKFGDMIANLFTKGNPYAPRPGALWQTEKRWGPKEQTPNADSSKFGDMLAYMYAGGNPFGSNQVWQTGISQTEKPMKQVVNTPNADSIQFDDRLANLFANNGVEMPRVRRGMKSIEYPN